MKKNINILLERLGKSHQLGYLFNTTFLFCGFGYGLFSGWRGGRKETERGGGEGEKRPLLATSSKVRWGRELPLCYLIYEIKHKPTHKNKVPFAEERFRGHSKKRYL